MLEILKTELDDDPLTRGYASMSNGEAAQSLNVANITARRWVENYLIKQKVIEFGAWGVIVLATQDVTVSPIVRVLCINVRDWVDDRTGKIEKTDLDLPSSQSMLAGLVAAEILTEQQSETISNLANAEISRAEQLGLPAITDDQVRDARSLS